MMGRRGEERAAILPYTYHELRKEGREEGRKEVLYYYEIPRYVVHELRKEGRRVFDYGIPT